MERPGTVLVVEDHPGVMALAVVVLEGAGWNVVQATSAPDARSRLAAGEIRLFDVRETSERDDGFIPGSTHLPYRNVRAAAENGLCDELPIVTICESGARAAIAASVLRSVGVDARPVLGGIATWPGETYSFRRCGSS